MTLRTKLVVVVCLSCALSIIALFLVQKTIISTRFAKLERDNTNQNTGRAVSALQADVSSVRTMVGDWAPWDDTYVFVQDGNSDYIANNLTDATVSNLGVNLILYVNDAGELVHGKAMDLENGVEIPLPSSVAELVSPESPLMQITDGESSVSGIVSLPEGPLLVASQPILTSQKQGPSQGTLIMGRFLDAAEVRRLAELTSLSIEVYPLQDSSMPADVQLAQSSLSKDQPVLVQALSSDSIAGYGLLTDVYGNPTLVLRVDQTRDIYGQGQQTIGYFILTLLMLFVWAGGASFFLLDRFLFSRLSRLSEDVERASASHDPAERVPDKGDDEFARVAQSVNRTLSSLEQARRELAASESRNRALIAGIPDLILRVGRDGVLLDRGPAKADGVAKGGQESTSRWPGETSEERRAFAAEILQHASVHVKQALETGEACVFEFQAVLNGRVRRYQARVVASGEDEALVVARDITLEKLQEETRRIAAVRERHP